MSGFVGGAHNHIGIILVLFILLVIIIAGACAGIGGVGTGCGYPGYGPVAGVAAAPYGKGY
ncbi:hypothetical protein I8J29_23530 [Paenibacillus sp. MWE-103]|uniref:Sporulation protein YjcZ n=1 Tax=Paenibacillus artemisiicola TaxID=1172618 RepID=A0ABS3WFZ4_9BACL|nr:MULTISPECIES: hypothetical protein [Paenibacillus]MBO7747178.1 hypothetical protein [Paenibacillus artemisiicola]SFJ80786.1 hypothetical protein SAMN02799624_06062 [Paenibacillus sp. UNC496MF]